MANDFTCPECGKSHLSEEEITIAENGNPICNDCADKEA